MKRLSILEKTIFYLPLFALCAGPLALGQVAASAVSGSALNVFVSFGGQRTHVIDYTYNSLGVDGGLYVQRSPLIGIEVRAASYPMYARYSQSPLTAGYRLRGDIYRHLYLPKKPACIFVNYRRFLFILQESKVTVCRRIHFGKISSAVKPEANFEYICPIWLRGNGSPA